jgi:hypothetical protein
MQLIRELDRSNTRMVVGKSKAGACTDARTCRAPRVGRYSGSASQVYACCSRTRTRLEKGTRGGVSVVVAGAVQASVPVKLSWRRHGARDLRASSSASCLVRN